MRHLFFALVLANLALVAWTAWYAREPRTAASPSETGLPIRLVNEADAGRGGRPSGSGRAETTAGGPASRAEGARSVPGDPGAIGSDATDTPGFPADATTAGGPPPSAADAGGGPASPAVVGGFPSSSPGVPGVSPSARAAEGVGSIAAPTLVTPPVIEPPSPGLLAASADGARAEGASTSFAAPAAVARCATVGPFPEAARAEAASAVLESAGFTALRRSGQGEIWIGFWVHIDAIPTRQEANAMLSRLRENGLAEAYLIPGEEDGDIISLGVFNNMTRAGRLEDQVRRIGFVPLTVERTRPGTVHWLDVSVPAGKALDLDALGIARNRIEALPCATAG